MRRIAASLAIAATAIALGACGGGDAEPGASREATLVLDFQPNAVHAGIYAALQRGYYEDRGVNLDVRVPGSSTDAPKLLEAGQAEFAILDLNDVAIAREGGAQITPLQPIVNRPLAAVIAADPNDVREPADLAGATVGVTGLPSDDAVLDSILAHAGVDPTDVERIKIGFDSVAALSAGRVDAATAFWNAEGVALRELGTPTREFRVDDYGAPRYPELMLVTSRGLLRDDRELIDHVVGATLQGYDRVRSNPAIGLDALVDAVDGLDRESQAAQLQALTDARAFGGDPGPTVFEAYVRWASRYGVIQPGTTVRQLF
jgi:putative hydroxymethylpyrimidine transport system substrate-binding protein